MSTTHAEIKARIRAIPLGVIPYSQSTISPVTGRRADCSGLASYAWALPTTGDGVWLRAYSTESLVRTGMMRQIPFSELQGGDAIGFCGPGTANGGGGHIAIWLSGDRIERGLYHIWDHGSGMGPKDRWVRWDGVSTGWLHPSKLKAWRYINIQEEDDMAPDERIWLHNASSVIGNVAMGKDTAPILHPDGKAGTLDIRPLYARLVEGVAARLAAMIPGVTAVDLAPVLGKLDELAEQVDEIPGEVGGELAERLKA